jgi:energy-coupling factor transport system ATP-binding protein
VNLQVEGLSYIYNPGTPLERKALSDVAFSLPGGKTLGIVGATGSGKTTLVKNLNGLLVPSSGRVIVDGSDAASLGSELRRRVGLVFQRPERQLFGETVYEDITFVRNRSKETDAADLYGQVSDLCAYLGLNLEAIKDLSPLTLTDADKRKVAIAGVLINDPSIVIMDEPAVGLDPPSARDLVEFLKKIKSKGKSIIIVSHDMEPFLRILDLMLILDDGRAKAFGAPHEVCDQIRDNALLRRIMPPLALLVYDLRRAGAEIPEGEYDVEIIMNKLRSTVASGGDR